MKTTILTHAELAATGQAAEASERPRPKQSSVRHTRAIQRDRSKRPTVAGPPPEIAKHLTELVHPATLAQVAYYHQLGLRARILTLPVMVAFVLSLIWRQMGSVAELVRVLSTEGLLWTTPQPVSDQAVLARLRMLPADLFARVLHETLPQVDARWRARTRPMPLVLAWAQEHYSAVLTVDASTLDALMRKVGLLRDQPNHPLAGRMLALLDLGSRLPRQVWYEEDPQAHDQRWWETILAALPAGALFVFDLAYTNFARFAELTMAHITFVTRAKSNLAYELVRTLHRTTTLRESLIAIGSGADRQVVRLIEVFHKGTWWRYLTNECDPARLPAAYAIALYGDRWRIEDAFNLVKRLLGLAYFWVGSANGVQIQVWATWLLYTVLLDLTDAVAGALHRPVADLSVEMVYRGLYHYASAYQRGEATDPVAYLAAHAKRLGLIKRKRPARQAAAKQLLTAAAGP